MGAAYPADTPPPAGPADPPPGGPFPTSGFDDDGNPIAEPMPTEPTDLAPEDVAALTAAILDNDGNVIPDPPPSEPTDVPAQDD